MSRSTAKRYRICPTYKYFKKLANKKVRKTKDISNGMSYKKLFESWVINDSGKSRLIPKLNDENIWWVVKAIRK